MSRFLLLAAVIAVVYLLLRFYRKQLPGKGAQEDNVREKSVSAQAEDMVRCVHCGVHLPKHESVVEDGKFYCSEAHRSAHSRKSE